MLARVRLVTDRGYFTGDGEGFGAAHALRLAVNAVERQLLKGKTYGQSKNHPDTVEQEQLYGWWLGGIIRDVQSPIDSLPGLGDVPTVDQIVRPT